MSNTPIQVPPSADRPHRFAFGSLANQAVNARLNESQSPPPKGLQGTCDTFTRTLRRDVQAGARLCAQPRHLLNHLAGGNATRAAAADKAPTDKASTDKAPKAAAADKAPTDEAPTATAADKASTTTATDKDPNPTAAATDKAPTPTAMEHGLIWQTLKSASHNIAGAAGCACGLLGTGLGAMAGLVLPAVSNASAQDCIDSTSQTFRKLGTQLAGGILLGTSALVSEAVTGVSAALTGILAGVGAIVGGIFGMPHAAFQAVGAMFRREGAEALVEATNKGPDTGSPKASAGDVKEAFRGLSDAPA